MTPTRSEPSATARDRALAPDLARGTMLALIALAHSQVLAHNAFPSAANPGASPLDTIVQALLTLFVDSRSYPMFAALFGYGMVQILRKQEHAGGWEHARRLLRRRGWWMVAFGFCHVLLLFVGDIIASYGFLAVLFVGALRWRDGRLIGTAAIAAVLGAIAYGAVLAAPVPAGDPSDVLTDPLVSAVFRVALFPVMAPLNALMAAGAVLLGVWAARRLLLEDVERNRVLLQRLAGGGIAVAAVGAIPQALVTTSVWQPAAASLLAVGALHTLTGYAGGLGYAALIGLVATRLRTRRGPLVTALAACGQRSLSCYLGQSVAWFLLFEPYLADFGGALGTAAAAAVGLAVWLATVLVADLLGRSGIPGPAEALLRRLTYGRPRPHPSKS